MPGLSLNLDSRPQNAWVLAIGGRPLPEDAARLDDVLGSAIASKPRLLVVDCSKLEFLGSFGIGALVHLQKAIEKQGGTIRLASVSDPILKLLQASRLDHRIPIIATVDAALR